MRPPNEAQSRRATDDGPGDGGVLERQAKVLGDRCDQGDREACAALVELARRALKTIERHHPSHDAAARRVLDALEKACRAGDGAGCRDSAMAHVRGDRVPADPVKGRILAELGCSGSLTEGCTELAFLYADGVGVSRDLPLARALFERGCNGGDGGGCLGLGELLASAPEPDVAKVTRLFQRGCELGYAKACFTLGALLLEGRVAPRDEAGGRAWMAKACQLGDLPACPLVGGPIPRLRDRTAPSR